MRDPATVPCGLCIGTWDANEESSFHCELADNHEGIVIRVNQWYGEKFIWSSRCMKEYLQNQNASTTLHPDDIHKLYRWGFWTLFQFHDQVLNRADEIAGHVFSTQWNKTSSSSSAGENDTAVAKGYPVFHPYIGVHIRGERHKKEDEHRQFLQCAQGLRDKIFALEQEDSSVSATPRLIFVTDDSYVGKPREGMNTTEKGLLKLWDPDSVRIADTYVFHTELTKNSGQAKQGNIDSYAEVVILLNSECLVRSRSGFSELPHRISISNEDTFERCGVNFRECDSVAIEHAPTVLQWARRKGKELSQNENSTWSSWI